MSYNLFLDDVRMPEQVGNYILPVELGVYFRTYNWEIVRDYDQFVNCIKTKGIPNVVSFDHDLAAIHYEPSTWTESFVYKEKTGYDCAKWMIDYCKENNLSLPKIIMCHSMNPVGKKRIVEAFK